MDARLHFALGPEPVAPQSEGLFVLSLPHTEEDERAWGRPGAGARGTPI